MLSTRSMKKEGEKEGLTPQEPELATAAVVSRLISEAQQTPTPQTTSMSMPKIERLTIETQTDPLEVDSNKLATSVEDTKVPSTRMPLQRRPQSLRENSRDNGPRETYRNNPRETLSRRSRENPRPVTRDHRSSAPARNGPLLSKPAGVKPVSSKPAATKPALQKPALQKPRVDIKLANEKIGAALAEDNKMKAEEVRSEQLAAIEDVVKAEQNYTVDKTLPTLNEEDKENNQNVQQTVNNQNVKVDNQKTKTENENIAKTVESGDPIIQTMVNEALVCEFSPSN